jgi:hypothetical protein
VTTQVSLPTAFGQEQYTLRNPLEWQAPATPFQSRIAYAAAHVVANPRGENVPGAPAVIDWDSTLAFRRHLWSFGFGVADAMDTAQRGMGLDWKATQELVRRSAAEARACGGRIACGAGTDHLHAGVDSLNDIATGYEEQVAVVEAAGATVILMASRQLAATASGPADYQAVYGRILGQVTGKVIIHWLGSAFDPALAGYWGSESLDRATSTVLELVEEHATHIDGVKVSLLNAEHEVRLRRSLQPAVRLYTGDDFHYPELIRGDEIGHSDALLGIFAAIAPVAADALQALDAGELLRYDQILAPTLPLARHIFGHPTYFYKTDIAFISWISGLQPGFGMVGGLQSGRSVLHLAETFRLADQAGLLPDPALAIRRMRSLLETAGVSGS